MEFKGSERAHGSGDGLDQLPSPGGGNDSGQGYLASFFLLPRKLGMLPTLPFFLAWKATYPPTSVLSNQPSHPPKLPEVSARPKISSDNLRGVGRAQG